MDDDYDTVTKTKPSKSGDRLARLGFSKKGVVLTKTQRPEPKKAPPPPAPAEPETTTDVELEG